MAREIHVSPRPGGGFLLVVAHSYHHDTESLREADCYFVSRDEASRLFGRLGTLLKRGSE